MKNTMKYWGSYRHPRTTQERRVTPRRNKWGRASRNMANLPSAYDDRPNGSWSEKKSWKSKRKTQYYCGGRGKQHSIYVPETNEGYKWCSSTWKQLRAYEHYFDEQEIPYRVDTHREVRREVVTHYWGVIEYNHMPWAAPIYGWKPYEKSYIRKYTTITGYTINFWTNKKIDLTFAENGV